MGVIESVDVPEPVPPPGGGETGFGGKEIYGSNQQPILPVFITQIVDGKVVEKARIDLDKN